MQNAWATVLNPIIKTVNALYGSGVTQEFAWNSGNVTAAGGSDLLSFGHGPGGTALLSYDSATLNSSTSFKVRFLKEIKPETDLILLEWLQANVPAWMSIADSGQQFVYQNTALFGTVINSIPNNKMEVLVGFGNAGADPYNTAYGAAGGTPWSTFAGYRWRVRKISFE